MNLILDLGNEAAEGDGLARGLGLQLLINYPALGSRERTVGLHKEMVT